MYDCRKRNNGTRESRSLTKKATSQVRSLGFSYAGNKEAYAAKVTLLDTKLPDTYIAKWIDILGEGGE